MLFLIKKLGGEIGGKPFPLADWAASKKQAQWLGGRTKKYL